MSEQSETHLAMAERRVREARERVAHQIALIDGLERDDHPAAAVRAREVLAILQHSLEPAREHLRIEQDMRRHRAESSSK